MRRSTLVVLAASAAIASAATRTLTAQEAPKHPIQFIVTGGATVPTGDLKEVNDLGFHVDGSVLFRFAGFPLALRPELSLTRMKQKVPTFEGLGAAAQAETFETTQMIGALGDIELPLFAGLYVIAGVGALKLDNSLTSETNVTVNAGAGWRFQLGRLGGFLEGRFGSASYDAGVIGYSSAQFIPVSFGLIF